MKLSKWLSGAMVAAGLVSAVGPAFAQEKLTVWWVKGFYKAEDDALFAAIRKFEEKNKNIKIDLSLYPIQDMIPKTVAALDSGSSTGKTCWLNQATKNQIFLRTGIVTGTSGALRCKLVIAKKLVSVALVQAFPWASIQPTRSFLS